MSKILYKKFEFFRTPRAFQRQIPIPQISVEDTDKSQVETEIM